MHPARHSCRPSLGGPQSGEANAPATDAVDGCRSSAAAAAGAAGGKLVSLQGGQRGQTVCMCAGICGWRARRKGWTPVPNQGSPSKTPRGKLLVQRGRHNPTPGATPRPTRSHVPAFPPGMHAVPVSTRPAALPRKSNAPHVRIVGVSVRGVMVRGVGATDTTRLAAASELWLSSRRRSVGKPSSRAAVQPANESCAARGVGGGGWWAGPVCVRACVCGRGGPMGFEGWEPWWRRVWPGMYSQPQHTRARARCC